MIDVQHAAGIATITLSEPRIHNAIGATWPADMADAIDRAVAGEPRVIVVRGAGPSFCSGVNTKDFGQGRLGLDWFRAVDDVMVRLDRVAVPTVASIHGFCLGAGLQLASVCDIRVTGASAKLGLPAASEGLIPGMSFPRLSRLIGASWAADLVLSGEVLSASAAAAIGLVTRVSTDDDPDEVLRGLTDRLAQAPARATALSKSLLSGYRMDRYDDFTDGLLQAMGKLLPGPIGIVR